MFFSANDGKQCFFSTNDIPEHGTYPTKDILKLSGKAYSPMEKSTILRWSSFNIIFMVIM
jgi:hypothetical protein